MQTNRSSQHAAAYRNVLRAALASLANRRACSNIRANGPNVDSDVMRRSGCVTSRMRRIADSHGNVAVQRKGTASPLMRNSHECLADEIEAHSDEREGDYIDESQGRMLPFDKRVDPIADP